MMRIAILLASIMLAGCAGIASTCPTVPAQDPQHDQSVIPYNHPLDSYYNLVFSDDHSSAEIVYPRETNFHLNALKFLEFYPCTDCVSLGNMTQVSDEIIELDVTIHNPYVHDLHYCAFDVKGTVMFDGSFQVAAPELAMTYTEISPLYMSWALRGDWELINPDGYSYFWSPPFNPDSNWPITQYYEGKYSIGEPSATINAYKSFYSDEDRHLFRPGEHVTRTYRIHTQPGPLTVGYAVDASWAPPTVKTVVNPLNDFPPEANQPEPYKIDILINNGDPIQGNECCGSPSNNIFIFIKQWNEFSVERLTAAAHFQEEGVLKQIIGPHDYIVAANFDEITDCNEECGEDCYYGMSLCFLDHGYPEGTYRLVSIFYRNYWPPYADIGVGVTDFIHIPY